MNNYGDDNGDNVIAYIYFSIINRPILSRFSSSNFRFLQSPIYLMVLWNALALMATIKNVIAGLNHLIVCIIGRLLRVFLLTSNPVP